MAELLGRRSACLRFEGEAIILREFAKEILRQHDATWEVDRRTASATARLEVTLPPGFAVVLDVKEGI